MSKTVSCGKGFLFAGNGEMHKCVRDTDYVRLAFHFSLT